MTTTELEAMARLEAALADNAKQYQDLDDDQIRLAIGVTARATERGGIAAPTLESASPREVLEGAETEERLEGLGDMVSLAASRILSHAERMSFEMCCGDSPIYAPLRRKLAKMIAEDADVSDIAGALAVVFVGWLGFAQHFAAAVAVLVARRLLTKTMDGFCDAWSARQAGSPAIAEA